MSNSFHVGLDIAKALDDVVQQLRAQHLALQEVRHRFGASVERLHAGIEAGEMTLSTSMVELAHALERFSNEVDKLANKQNSLGIELATIAQQLRGVGKPKPEEN